MKRQRRTVIFGVRQVQCFLYLVMTEHLGLVPKPDVSWTASSEITSVREVYLHCCLIMMTWLSWQLITVAFVNIA